MKILVTNDDGISHEGLWILVRELSRIAQVVVVAPHREQSAVGTAVTHRRPLTVQRMNPVVPGVETYSVEGTPADSVILALGKLVTNGVDMVISGINPGLNLGSDVLISGTVGAALQGYLRGLPSIAVSAAAADSLCLNNAAKFAALLAKKVNSEPLPGNIFLNVNLPGLPLAKIGGVKITRLSGKSHLDTIEETDDGTQKHYWLVRLKVNSDRDEDTDVWALERGNISITPLHADLSRSSSVSIPESLYSDLLQQLLHSHTADTG